MSGFTGSRRIRPRSLRSSSVDCSVLPGQGAPDMCERLLDPLDGRRLEDLLTASPEVVELASTSWVTRRRVSSSSAWPLLEHMVHQSVSENLWFETMLGIRVAANPLPPEETRVQLIELYARNASARLEQLRTREDAWWEERAAFFEVSRSRAWILTRRIAHTAHHRGQQTALLRMLNRDLHSTYGPSADTGGLMQDRAPVIYAYAGLADLLEQERGGRHEARLPGPRGRPVTERPAPSRGPRSMGGPS